MRKIGALTRSAALVRLGSALSVGLLPLIGCGGGGGAATPSGTALAAAFQGAWFTSLALSGGPCVPVGTDAGLGVASLSAAGGVATATLPGLGTLTGTATDSQVRLGGTLVVGGETLTFAPFDLALADSVWTGAATWSNAVGPCAGSGAWRLVPEFVLVACNLAGAGDVPLNQALVLTFSDDIDPSSLSSTAVEVTGATGPFWDVPSFAAVGPRAAWFPRPPTSIGLEDAGLTPGTLYTIHLPTAATLAADVVRSVRGAPLTAGLTGAFMTSAVPVFVETRRGARLLPGPLASPPGLGDLDGCLNDADSSLYAFPGFQTSASPAPGLLCLLNDGEPRIVPERCTPRHDERDVGTFEPFLSPVALGSLRIAFDEPLDPRTATLYNSQSMKAPNIQLWRVGDTAGNPTFVNLANEVQIHQPTLVQSGAGPIELVITPTTNVQPGTYVICVRELTDLVGLPLRVLDSPDPAPGGYAAIAASIAGIVPAGYHIYFRTVVGP